MVLGVGVGAGAACAEEAVDVVRLLGGGGLVGVSVGSGGSSKSSRDGWAVVAWTSRETRSLCERLLK